MKTILLQTLLLLACLLFRLIALGRRARAEAAWQKAREWEWKVGIPYDPDAEIGREGPS